MRHGGAWMLLLVFTLPSMWHHTSMPWDVMLASSCISMALYCPSRNKASRGTKMFFRSTNMRPHDAMVQLLQKHNRIAALRDQGMGPGTCQVTCGNCSGAGHYHLTWSGVLTVWWLGADEEYSYRYNNHLTKIFFRSTNMRPRDAMVQLYRSTTGSLHSGIKGWLSAHVRWLVATAVLQDITTSREAECW